MADAREELRVEVKTNLLDVLRKFDEEMRKGNVTVDTQRKFFEQIDNVLKTDIKDLRDFHRISADIKEVLSGGNVILRREADVLRLIHALHERAKAVSGDTKQAYEATYRLASRLAEQVGVSHRRMEDFARAAAGMVGSVRQGLPLTMRWGRTIHDMAEGTHRLTRRYRVYEDSSGRVYEKQLLSAKLIQSFAQGLEGMLGRLLRGMTLWGALAVLIYEMVDGALKFSGYLAQIQGRVGIIRDTGERLGGAVKMIGATLANITQLTGKMVGSVKEWVDELSKAGFYTAALAADEARLVNTAAIVQGLQEATGVSVSEATRLVERLHLSFGMTEITAAAITKDMTWMTDEATKFLVAVTNVGFTFSAFGLQASKTVSDMTELVALADRYNLDVRNTVNFYTALLSLKFSDKDVSKIMRDLSMETLNNFAQMSVKASSMGLSWKVMVATLAGEKFKNIWDLEAKFRNIGFAGETLLKAGKTAIHMFFTTEELKSMVGALEKQGKTQEEASNIIATGLMDVAGRIYEELGMSEEMVAALVRSEISGGHIERSLREQLKQAEEIAKYRQQPILLGFNIMKQTQGIAGFLKSLLGYVINIAVNVSNLASKFVGRAESPMAVALQETAQQMSDVASYTQSLEKMWQRDIRQARAEATGRVVEWSEMVMAAYEKFSKKFEEAAAVPGMRAEMTKEWRRWLETESGRMLKLLSWVGVPEAREVVATITAKLEAGVDHEALRKEVDDLLKKLEQQETAGVVPPSGPTKEVRIQEQKKLPPKKVLRKGG
jgi:hypothetical protein